MEKTDRRASIRLTHAQRKVVAELLPLLADRLLLSTAKTRTIPFTLEEIQLIHQKAQESIPHAETGVTGHRRHSKV